VRCIRNHGKTHKILPNFLENSKTFTFSKTERFYETMRNSVSPHDERFSFNPREHIFYTISRNNGTINIQKSLSRDNNFIKARMTPTISLEKIHTEKPKGLPFEKMLSREKNIKNNDFPIASSIEDENIEKYYTKLSTKQTLKSFNIGKSLSRIHEKKEQILPLFMECSGTRLSISNFCRKTFDLSTIEKKEKFKSQIFYKEARTENSLKKQKTMENSAF